MHKQTENNGIPWKKNNPKEWYKIGAVHTSPVFCDVYNDERKELNLHSYQIPVLAQNERYGLRVDGIVDVTVAIMVYNLLLSQRKYVVTFTLISLFVPLSIFYTMSETSDEDKYLPGNIYMEDVFIQSSIVSPAFLELYTMLCNCIKGFHQNRIKHSYDFMIV